MKLSFRILSFMWKYGYASFQNLTDECLFVMCFNILKKSIYIYIWMYHFYHSFDLNNKLFGCTLSRKTSWVTLYMSYLIIYFLMFLSWWHVVTLIQTWISNYNHYKLWDEISYPFPNFNGVTVEVWEWISNFIDIDISMTCNFILLGMWLLIHAGFKVNPC